VAASGAKGSSAKRLKRVLFGVSDWFAVDRFQTIYARQRKGGWFRLTKDRQWLPVHGLPNDLVMARLDPGQREILPGLSSGIYAVDANGQARKLDGQGAPSHIIRTLAGTASGIPAGGDDGLFEISKDVSRIVPVDRGSVGSIGSVQPLPIHEGEFAKASVPRKSARGPSAHGVSLGSFSGNH
jgi:hypothetical protein